MRKPHFLIPSRQNNALTIANITEILSKESNGTTPRKVQEILTRHYQKPWQPIPLNHVRMTLDYMVSNKQFPVAKYIQAEAEPKYFSLQR